MRKKSYIFSFVATLLLLFIGNSILFANPSTSHLTSTPDNPRAQTLTVADGTTTNNYIPVYGLYLDNIQRTQMVYDATLLTAMQGKQIEKLTFYTSSGPNTPWTGIITVSLAMTTGNVSAGFLSPQFDDVYTGLLVVANGQMVIEFTTPFTYTGNNLLIQFNQPVAGNYSSCSFYGTSSTGNGREAHGTGYSGNGTLRNFLPKTTFEYDNVSTCPKPSMLQLISSFSTSALLSWTENGTATTWQLQYGNRGFTLGTGTIQTFNNDTATITGLTPDSYYDVYVRSICGAGDTSNWSVPINFMTTQIAGTVPYLADFEDDAENALWGYARNADLNRPNNWYIDTAVNYGGMKSLYITNNTGRTNAYTTASAPCAVWAYRDIYFTPAAEYELKFDWQAIGQTTVDYMRVYIGTPAPVTASTTTTFSPPTAGVGLVNPLNGTTNFNAWNGEDNVFTTWNSFSKILPSEYSGTTQRIYFLWVNNDLNGTQPPAAIDNLSIISKNCSAPINLTATNITQNSATIQWDIVNNESVFEIAYSTQSDFNPDTATLITVSDTTYTLTGLQSKVTYYVKVRAVCGTENSFWSVTLPFQTAQIPTTLPYFCDFENATERNNWDLLNSTNTNKWYINSGVNNTPSGSYSVYISTNGTAHTYTSGAVTIWAYRDITFNILGDYQFSFDWICKGESTWDFMNVFVGDRVPITATTTNSRPIAPPAGANAVTLTPTPITNTNAPTYFNLSENWQQYNGTFPASYYGTTKRLYFAWTNDGSGHYAPPAAVDNIFINVNTCVAPTQVQIPDSTISTNSVVIHWNDTLNNAWIVEYKVLTDTVWSTVSVSNNPYTLSNLTPATKYQVRVKADCGGGDESFYTNIVNFQTTCAIITTFPWSYDFENEWESVGVPLTAPLCWNNIDMFNTTYKWVSYATGGINNSGCARFSGSSSVGNNDYLITPYLTLTGDEQLRFWVKANTSYSPKLTIMGLASQTSTIGSTITTITVTHTDYQEYIVDLSAYIGDYCFAFARKDTGQYDVYLDNVVIETIPACPAPTGVFVSNVRHNSARVTWTASPGTTDFQIAISTQPGFNPDTVAPIAINGDTTYLFTSLTPLTTYYFAIRTNCGSDYSTWTLIDSFTMGQIPLIVPFTYDFENNSENLNWQFANSTNDNKWHIGTATNNTPGGNNAMYISSDNGITNTYTGNRVTVWAYRDILFDTQADYYLLSFDWKGKGESSWDFMSVFIGDAVPVVATTTNSRPIPAPNRANADTLAPTPVTNNPYPTYFNLSDVWQQYSGILPQSYYGTFKRIYFAWTNDGGGMYNPPAVIDNLSIGAYSCPRVTGVTVPAGSITSTGAVVNWVAGGSETNWIVEYRASDDTTWTIVNISNNPTCTLTTLTSATTYIVRVKADCGGSNVGPYSSSIYFSTTQLPATLPYNCDFENSNENRNWQYVNRSNQWVIGSAIYNSPTKALYVTSDGVTYDYNHNNSSIWAYRDITFPSGNQFVLSFDWQSVGEMLSSTPYDYMKVYIGDRVDVSNTLVATGPAGAVNLGGFLNAQPNWTNYSTTLDSSYANTTKRLYIGWREDGSGTNGPPAAVDNISIFVYTCPDVTNITVPDSSITPSEAVVYWQAGGSETNWIVEYKAADEATWTIVNVSTNPVCTLTNLMSSTAYMVRIKADCGGGDLSNYSSVINFNSGCGVITSIPWSYDFPSTWITSGSRTAPYCWKNIDNNLYSYYWRYNSSMGIGSSGCAYYYGTSGTTTQNNAWLITPEITLSGNEQVTFFARNYSSSYAPIISVYLLTNQNDTTSGIRINSFTVNSTSYNEFFADLSAYTGVYSIAFVRRDKGNEGLYLDNISVQAAPTCYKPISLQATNIGATNATILWNCYETNPLGYELAYSTTLGFDPDTCSQRLQFTDSSSYTIPIGTLSPLTTYYLYLRTICGVGDTSDWNTTVLTITTCQNPGTLPYVCDFENATERNNWQLANSTATNKWYVGNAVNNTPSGSYAVYVSTNGIAHTYTSGSVTIWAYRDIYFDIAGEYILEFDWLSKGESSWDYMRVFIGDSVPVTGSTSNSRPIPPPAGANADILTPTPITNNNYPTYFNLSETWQHYRGTLPANYSGTTKRIYFAWTNDGSGFYTPPAAFDNIVINVNSCVSVSNVTVPDSSVTIDSAIVIWTPADSTDLTWSLEYKKANDTTWTVVPITGTPQYQLTNLSSSTTYEVRVRTDCGGGDYSFYSPIVFFQTPQIPIQVPFMCGFEDAAENSNWQFANVDLTTSPNWYIGSAVKYSGDSSLYISNNEGVSNDYGGSGTLVWAYRDIYFTPAGEYTLTFNWKCRGETTNDYMMAFIGDPKIVTAENSVVQVPVPEGAVTLLNELRSSNQSYFNGHDGSGYNNITWNTYSSLLDGTYSGKTKRLYFAWRNNGYTHNSPAIAIDNIAVAPVSCARPLNFAVVHVDTNSVTLNWTPAADESNFEIVLGGTANFVIDTATLRYVVSDTVITITNLNPNTSYYLYIRALCGENTTSSWSDIFPFMTTQPPLVVPFICDFEDATEVQNWGIVNNNDATYPNGWYIGNAANNGGTTGLYISDNEGVSNNYTGKACRVWAYRDIYFASQGDYELSFDWKCRGESQYDYMLAFIGAPTVVTAATAATVATPTNADTIYNSLTGNIRFNAYSGSSYVNTSWNTEVQRLTDCYGQTKRIYFEWINDGSVNNQPPIAIDNIIVNVNTCLAVSNVTIPEASITTDSVLVQWTSRGDETSWIIEYKLASASTWTRVIANSNPFMLTGLSPSSPYQLRVKAMCDDNNESFASEIVPFSTLCGTIVTIPWRYNFEEAWFPLGNRTAPYCWNNFDNGSYYYWRANATNGVNGSKCAYFYGTSSTSNVNDATLVTPEIQLNGNEQVSFYAKNYSSSYSPILSVYVLSNPNNLASGTLVSTFTVNTNNHQEYTADISAFSGNYYIAFSRQDNGNEGLYLDNILVEPIPPCKKPTSVTVTDPRGTYATINWTTTEVSPLGYEIAISTDPNFNPDTCTHTYLVGDTTSYTLPVGSLNPSNTYYVYVRTICNAIDTSAWNNIPASFETSQIPLEIPFLVDFEDSVENAAWQFTEASNFWIIGTGTSESPTHSLYVTNNSSSYGTYNISSSCDIWAYRDIIFPENGEQFTLSFDWKCVGELISNSYDYMKVYIGNIQNVDGITVASGPAGSSNLGGVFVDQAEWTSFTTTLAGSYAGTTKRLYFGWRNDQSGSDGPPAAVDNIKLIVNCTPPSMIYLFDVTESTALIVWTGTEENYNIEYGPRGFEQGTGTVVQVTGTSYTLTGLTPETDYTVYVQSDCGDGNTSEWLPYDFSTSPTGIDDNIINQNVTIYPNPVSSLLQIESDITFEHYEILNSTGQIVYQNNATENNFSIDVKPFAPGVYFIKLINNNEVVVKMFVKE